MLAHPQFDAAIHAIRSLSEPECKGDPGHPMEAAVLGDQIAYFSGKWNPPTISGANIARITPDVTQGI